MNWIIETEYIACTIITIILIYSNLFSTRVPSLKSLYFNFCLYVSLAAIIFNIISVYVINHAATVPLWLNTFINMLFFVTTPLVTISISLYALVVIYEHVPDKKGLRTARIAIWGLYAVFIALFLSNTGLFFRFDENFNYIRGPLNRLIYVIFLFDLTVCVVNHLIYKIYASKAFCKIVYFIIPLVALIIFHQLIFPETILSGIAAALTLFIFFINLQQQKGSIDILTGLVNRDGFFDILENYKKFQTQIRLLSVDVHGLRLITNHFGTKTTDLFLLEVAKYLKSISRNANMTVCRIGATQFTIICLFPGDAEYNSYVCGIVKQFEYPWRVKDYRYTLSACFTDAVIENKIFDESYINSFLEFAAHNDKKGCLGQIITFDKNAQKKYDRCNYVIKLIENAYKNDLFCLFFSRCLIAAQADFQVRSFF